MIRVGVAHRLKNRRCGACRILRGDRLDPFALINRDRLAQFDTHTLLTVIDLDLLCVIVFKLLQRHGGVHVLEGARVIPNEGEQVQGDENGGADQAPPHNVLIFAHRSLRDSSLALPCQPA